ncbi:MAG: amidohydrolase [Chloroflexi bacterium]|nr:amidohydrolase [Chloroflexota bacterium]
MDAAVDGRSLWLIEAAKTVLNTPEVGFLEAKTSALVGQKLNELGIAHESGIALTGIKGYIRGANPGPTVAIIGELDALRITGHPYSDPETGAAHACGHHGQIGALLGAAVALSAPGVRESLSGNVALIAVPAEEFIDIGYRWGLREEGTLGLLSGKQEFIRLGQFDDVDMAMMVHTSSSPEDARFSLGGTSNGHVAKYVEFIGRASHAGGSPEHGVNALQAAMVALNALNAQRETMRNEDAVRLHGIISAGGTSVNSVPADVRYEGRVRGRDFESITDASAKMDRCLRAGALATGAKVRIVTVAGYLPMLNDPVLVDMFRRRAGDLVGPARVAIQPEDRNRGGSTDMGDLSHLMPAIHPYTGAASGGGHGVDYLIDDYDQAVIRPAKAMAMMAVDLLSDNAVRAREVLAKSPPRMTKAEYLKLQYGRMSEELYEGK